MSNNNKQYKKSKVLNGIFGGILALVIAGGVAAVGVQGLEQVQKRRYKTGTAYAPVRR